MPLSNLYAAIPGLTEGEHFDELQRCGNVTVERIVSSSKTEPKLYVQEQDEWVVLLQGQACLEMNGKEHPLSSGDFLFIPEGTPHQVLDTSREPPCIWLAVHIFPHDMAT
ncbi:cupin domain-containing protein [Pseudomonadota bacterium]